MARTSESLRRAWNKRIASLFLLVCIARVQVGAMLAMPVCFQWIAALPRGIRAPQARLGCPNRGPPPRLSSGHAGPEHQQ